MKSPPLFPLTDIIGRMHTPLELWPTIVEICYYQKDKEMLPQIRIHNKRVTNGH